MPADFPAGIGVIIVVSISLVSAGSEPGICPPSQFWGKKSKLGK
jgi:hypothetical protein